MGINQPYKPMEYRLAFEPKRKWVDVFVNDRHVGFVKWIGKDRNHYGFFSKGNNQSYLHLLPTDFTKVMIAASKPAIERYRELQPIVVPVLQMYKCNNCQWRGQVGESIEMECCDVCPECKSEDLHIYNQDEDQE